MFKMIGGDGREYGPVTAEELSAWILDQRANGQTQVQAQGSAEWQPLSSLPEFAEVLQRAYPGAPTVVEGPASALEATVGAASRPDAGFTIGACVARGWLLLIRHFFLIVGACALVWLILTVTALATCIGGLVSLVVTGALQGGLVLLYLRLIRQQPAPLGVLFSCFGPLFVPLMLLGVVTSLATQVGLACCLAPGLFLQVIWAFALPLAADRGLAFWPALELSRQVVLRHFFRVAGLLVVAYLPLLVFGVYALWRVPTFLFDVLGPTSAWTPQGLLAHEEAVGRFLFSLTLQAQLAVLLSMPFGYAALLQAYEDLFGPSRATGDR